MHPAYKYTFDELYQNLLEEEKNEFVKSNTSGNLVQFTYTEEATFQKHWNDFTMSARGIILDIVNKKIVACPFSKFFNYGENNLLLPSEKFIVSEKLDRKSCYSLFL